MLLVAGPLRSSSPHERRTVLSQQQNLIRFLRRICFIVYIVTFFASKVSTAAMASPSRRVLGRLQPESTVLMVCDIQERLQSLIHNSETVVNTCRYMTSMAKELDIPVVVTQQYTKAFGATVPECFATAMPKPYEKKLFSMLTDEVKCALDSDPKFRAKSSYLLLGVETHVCVQQTCLDLLERGAEVHVIVDGVSSQSALDRSVALRRMEQSGAFLTTAQSAAFMLLGSAEHANFKPVSKLTVEHMKLKNEFNS